MRITNNIIVILIRDKVNTITCNICSRKSPRVKKTSKDLTWEEAKQAMRLMIEGTATQAQIGAFLTAMRFKSESVTELAAFTATARQYVPPVPVRSGLVSWMCPSMRERGKRFTPLCPPRSLRLQPAPWCCCTVWMAPLIAAACPLGLKAPRYSD